MTRQLNKIDRSMSGLNRSFGTVSKSATRMVGAFGPLIGVAGAGMLGRMGSQAISTTAALQDQADTAGVHVERLQELTKAFADLGGVQESVTTGALRRFNRRLGLAADGSGAARDTFGELGVSIRDVEGNLRGTGLVLDEAIRQLASIENDAERAARASELFGEDAGPRLAATLGRGTEAINTQIERLREQGRIMSQDAVNAASKLDDQLNELYDTLETLAKSGFVAFGQMLSRFAQDVSDTAEQIATIFNAPVTELQALNQRILEQREVVAQLQENLDTFGDNLAEEARTRLETRLDEAQALLDRLESRNVDMRAELRNSRIGGAGDSGTITATSEAIDVQAKAVTELTAEWEKLIALPPVTLGITDEELMGAEALSEHWAQGREEAEKLLREIDPLTQATHSYRESVESLNQVREAGLVTDERAAEIQRRLKDQLERQVSTYYDVGNAADDASQQAVAAADSMRRAWDQAMEGIQGVFADTFADMFSGELDSFERFMDRIQDIWSRSMGEMAATQVGGPVGGVKL